MYSTVLKTDCIEDSFKTISERKLDTTGFCNGDNIKNIHDWKSLNGKKILMNPLNAMCFPGLDPGAEKGHGVKTR